MPGELLGILWPEPPGDTASAVNPLRDAIGRLGYRVVSELSGPWGWIGRVAKIPTAEPSAPSSGVLVVGDPIPRSRATPEEAAQFEEDARGPESVVGALHARLGGEVTEALGGAFVVAVKESDGEGLTIFTDRFGMQPLYVCRQGPRLLLSTKVLLLATSLPARPSWNEAYAWEVMLFNYPLGEATCFEGIESLPPASRIEARRGGVTTHRYWREESLLSELSLGPREGSEACEEALAQALARRVPRKGNVALSLTGGFDGRTLLALLPAATPVSVYTFGTADSPDVTVASEICERAGLGHRRVLLDDGYLKGPALEASLESMRSTEGRSTFKRAHYAHTARILSEGSRVMVTGICGSELLRPVHALGEMYHPNLKALALSHRPEKVIRERLTVAETLWLRTGDAARVAESMAHAWDNGWAQRYPGASLDEKIFLFTVSQVLRKYFGPEVEMEAPHLPNRFPFLDEDFVDLLCRTPYAGFRKKAFRSSPVTNRLNQVFYARILARRSPLLASLDTARGYPPRWILAPAGFVRIAPRYLRLRRQERRRDDLAMVSLQELVYREISLPPMDSCVDDAAIRRMAVDGGWRRSALTASKAFTLLWWQIAAQALLSGILPAHRGKRVHTSVGVGSQ